MANWWAGSYATDSWQRRLQAATGCYAPLPETTPNCTNLGDVIRHILRLLVGALGPLTPIGFMPVELLVREVQQGSGT